MMPNLGPGDMKGQHMKKLAELQTRLKALKAEGLEIVEAAEADDRDLTEDEAARIAEIQSNVEDVNGQIEALERRAEARRSMEAISGHGGQDVPAGHRAYGQNRVDDLNPATTGGFKDIAEFASCVRQASRPGAVVDDRLRTLGAPTNFHTGGGDAGEGFNVPPQYRDEIFEVMQGVDELSPLLDEETTAARRVEMLANEETPWGSSGVQANWRSEGTQMSASKLDDEARSVPLHEIYAFVLATAELLEDAPRMAGRLTRRAGQALAWKRNQATIYGTGVGQPLGWFSSGALITVAKEGSQAADTIQAENVLKMISRLAVVPGDTPIWIANRNTIPELATMTIGDQPVWSGANMANGPFAGLLLGYPVLFSEHARTLGDAGDLHLVSPRGYYALRRDTGPQLATSIHLYFDYNIEAFRWMTRFGGQPHLSAPIDAPTAGGGSNNSKSHFVTLAERA
jgi:HK97 family phage major capsid protein